MAYPTSVMVTSPFGAYARGAQITDQAEIESIYTNGQNAWVVATEWAPPPAAPTTGEGAS